jgi:hypothetical protein
LKLGHVGKPRRAVLLTLQAMDVPVIAVTATFGFSFCRLAIDASARCK